MPKLSDLLPSNLSSVKATFIKSPDFNPKFTYSKNFTQEELSKHGQPNDICFQLAQEIVSKAYHNKTEAELFASEGTVLSQAEVTRRTTDYLLKLNLSNRFQIKWSAEYLVRSSATADEVRLRLPCNFREEGFLGMLNHEIGTHVVRRINDEQQPWHGQRKKFNLRPYLKTEEGLASLHSQINKSVPYNFIDSLRYMAVYTAQRGSFLDVWSALDPYVDDLDRRWMICVRAKRGLRDTSQPGGYTKDMLYLSGSIHVWRWMTKNQGSISQLFIGKVSTEDCQILQSISRSGGIILPFFVSDNAESYFNEILKIGVANMFDQASKI